MKVQIEISDDLVRDIKMYLEDDIGADFPEEDWECEVTEELLKEGTMSMIIPDMDRIKTGIKIEVIDPVKRAEEQTEPEGSN